MLLNETVEDKVYFAYRKSQIQGMDTPRLKCIHVSDLIKPCMRLVTYNNMGEPAKTAQDIKSMFIGQAIHAITDLSTDKFDHEKLLLYDWVNDKGIKAEELYMTDDPNWHKGNPWNFIAGSIDDIVYVDGEAVIVDKKTTGSIEYFHSRTATANEGHRLQINCYSVLLEKCYGIKAKKGCVMYIPNSVSKDNSIKNEPIAHAFNLTKPEETLNMMKTNAAIIKDAMTNKTLPGRTKNFLCDGMCPYAVKCFTDDRVKWT